MEYRQERCLGIDGVSTATAWRCSWHWHWQGKPRAKERPATWTPVRVLGVSEPSRGRGPPAGAEGEESRESLTCVGESGGGERLLGLREEAVVSIDGESSWELGKLPGISEDER